MTTSLATLAGMAAAAILAGSPLPPWGFGGHEMAARAAAGTLPAEMISGAVPLTNSHIRSTLSSGGGCPISRTTPWLMLNSAPSLPMRTPLIRSATPRMTSMLVS